MKSTTPPKLDSLSQLLPCSPETPPFDYPPPPPRTATARLLESITARMIEMTQNAEWTHPDWDWLVAQDYIAETPTASFSGTPFAATVGRQSFIDGVKAYKEAYPGFRGRPWSIAADVDEVHGTGSVLVHSHVHGNPPPLVMEGVTVMDFVLTKQGWRAVKQITLGGPRAF